MRMVGVMPISEDPGISDDEAALPPTEWMRLVKTGIGARKYQTAMVVIWRLTRTAVKNAIADSIETRNTVRSTAT
jgi:hypothetical protein